MSHKFLYQASFHKLLLSIDVSLTEVARQEGCHFCGGQLHQAHYPRSPLGVPVEFREYYNVRNSLCCGKCRKRMTVQTVRFFGRSWYPMPLRLLIAALSSKTGKRKTRARVQKIFGFSISHKTWKRWQHWWKNIFGTTTFWQIYIGSINTSLLTGPFPRVFFISYRGFLQERLVKILKFLSPLTNRKFANCPIGDAKHAECTPYGKI